MKQSTFGLYIICAIVSFEGLLVSSSHTEIMEPRSVSVQTLREEQENLMISHKSIILALLTALSKKENMFARVSNTRVIARGDGTKEQDPSVALYMYFTLSYEYNMFLDLANKVVKELSDPETNTGFKAIQITRSSDKRSISRKLLEVSGALFRELVELSRVTDGLPLERVMRTLKSVKPRSPFFKSIMENLELLKNHKTRISDMVTSQDMFHSRLLMKLQELEDARTTTTTTTTTTSTTTTTTTESWRSRLAPWANPATSRTVSRWAMLDDSDTD